MEQKRQIYIYIYRERIRGNEINLRERETLFVRACVSSKDLFYSQRVHTMSAESKGLGLGEIELQSVASLKKTIDALQGKIELLSHENEALRKGHGDEPEDEDFTMGDELELRKTLQNIEERKNGGVEPALLDGDSDAPGNTAPSTYERKAMMARKPAVVYSVALLITAVVSSAIMSLASQNIVTQQSEQSNNIALRRIKHEFMHKIEKPFHAISHAGSAVGRRQGITSLFERAENDPLFCAGAFDPKEDKFWITLSEMFEADTLFFACNRTGAFHGYDRLKRAVVVRDNSTGWERREYGRSTLGAEVRNVSHLKGSQVYEPRRQSWYTVSAAPASRAPAWTALQQSDASEYSIITTVSRPVRDSRTGAFIGVVGGTFSLSSARKVLVSAKEEAFRHDAKDEIVMNLIATDGGADYIVASSHPGVQQVIDKHIRSSGLSRLKVTSILASEELAGKGVLVTMQNTEQARAGTKVPDYILSHDQLSGFRGFPTLSFTAGGHNSYFFQYAQNAIWYTMVIVLLGVVLISLVAFVLKRVHESNEGKIREVETSVLEQCAAGNIHIVPTETAIDRLEGLLVVSPSGLNLILSILTVSCNLLVVYFWMTYSREAITGRAETLVRQIGIGVDSAVKLFFQLPLDYINLLGAFGSLNYIPQGYLHSQVRMDTTDAVLADTFLQLGPGAPYMAYIGSEDGGFQGVKIKPGRPLGLSAVTIDNSTGYDSCTNTPLRLERAFANTGWAFPVRNTSQSQVIAVRKGYDPRKRTWYKQSKVKGEVPNWSPLYPFFSGPIGITASKAVNNSGIFSVIAADYTMDAISVQLKSILDQVKREIRGLKGSAYIVEKDGNLIATSSDVPVSRVFFPGASPQRVHAAELCDRQDKFPDECDEFISVSYAELQARVGDSALNAGLENHYKNGYTADVGRGASTNTVHLRVSSLKDRYGLDWVLVVGIGGTSFFNLYEKQSSSSLMIALALMVGVVGAASRLVSHFYTNEYGESGELTADDRKLLLEVQALVGGDEDEEHRENPDSEAFFRHFRKMITPTVLAANMACRLGNKAEASPPRVFETIAKILDLHGKSANAVFSKLDKDGNGFLSLSEVETGLVELGYQPTPGEIDLLFAAIDKNGDGMIAYDEIFGDSKNLQEPSATRMEKQRALDYVLLAQNKNANLMDYFYLQRSQDTARMRGYVVFHSRWYNALVFLGIVLNLSITFMEAPASQKDYFTKSNYAGRLPVITAVSVLALLTYVVDVVFQVWLFGVYIIERSSREAKKVTSSRGAIDNILLEGEHRGASEKRLDTITMLRLAVLLGFIVDLCVPYTTGSSKDDATNVQIVFLVPLTALLRPLWPVLRYGGIRKTLFSFAKTIWGARSVFALFALTLLVFSVIGVCLLSNRHGYGAGDNFPDVLTSIMTLFVYMATAENYPDVVYPSVACPGSEDANTREGGILTGGCPDALLHIYTMAASLTGMFLIVSLVIAVFEDKFSEHTAQDKVNERKRRRIGIIAAFIILDKDGGGTLDESEFITFLNGTCHTGRHFNVAKDFELSGMEFVELVEELVHEIKRVPVSKLAHVPYENEKTFGSCSIEELHAYLSNSELDGVPEMDTFLAIEDPDLQNYWRHRALEHFEIEGSVHSHAVGKAAKGKVDLLKAFLSSELHELLSSLALLTNSLALCLYGTIPSNYIPILDVVNLLFMCFWFVELGMRVYAFGWRRYYFVNHDFFREVGNRLDLAIVSVTLLVFLLVLVTRSAAGLKVFKDWNDCVAPEDCAPNDWTRLILTLNSLRLFGVVKSVREIFYSFYVIIPNYSEMIVVACLLLYFYAVWGCILFGGWFKYLNNYDIPQANFNSMQDAVTTLLQLFVGEAWNSVMGAGFNTKGGSSASIYFISYVLLTTLLFTNLLVGVIISGYGQVREVQENARKNRFTKLPSKHIVTALTEGGLKERRLAFRYEGAYEIVIEKVNGDLADEGEDGSGEGFASAIKNFDSQHGKIPSQIHVTKDRHGFHTEQTVRFLADVAYKATEASKLVQLNEELIKGRQQA
jgi:Ca2+-binding EF-hand superfamily protein